MQHVVLLGKSIYHKSGMHIRPDLQVCPQNVRPASPAPIKGPPTGHRTPPLAHHEHVRPLPLPICGAAAAIVPNWCLSALRGLLLPSKKRFLKVVATKGRKQKRHARQTHPRGEIDASAAATVSRLAAKPTRSCTKKLDGN